MDILAAARALNQKAVEAKSYHLCDPTLAFNDPVHQQLLSLWRGKAGSRVMPAKSELTPRDLKDFLGSIVICERVAENPSHYTWRLVGTNVSDVVGHVTGKTFEESAPAEVAMSWTECIDLILNCGSPLRFLGRVRFKNREYLNAENLYVPLTNDEGHPTFVMGLCRYSPRVAENEEGWANHIAAIPSGLL